MAFLGYFGHFLRFGVVLGILVILGVFLSFLRFHRIFYFLFFLFFLFKVFGLFWSFWSIYRFQNSKFQILLCINGFKQGILKSMDFESRYFKYIDLKSKTKSKSKYLNTTLIKWASLFIIIYETEDRKSVV